MTVSSTTISRSALALLEELFDGVTTDALCVGLDESQTAGLIEALGDMTDPPEVELLTSEPVLKWVREDFILASEAVDLIDAGVLSIGVTEEAFRNVLVILQDTVLSVIGADELIAGCPTDDTGFVEAATEEWSEVWDAREEFSLRTPARSRVEVSLEETFGSEFVTDFGMMLAAIESTRGEGLDEVDICLLVAAKHDEQLYEISRWGEDSGVASKASFSRQKTALEEQGVIKTEKIPIEVGRPRLRLVLPEELRDVTAEELPAAVSEFAPSPSA